MLTACGVSATPVRPTVTPPPVLVSFPTPPTGWKIFTTTTFQLALPDGWQEFKLNEDSLKSTVKQNQATNPDLSRLLQQVLDAGEFKTLLFYAADTKATGIVGNVSIGHTTPGGATRSEDVAKQAADALAKNLTQAKNVTTTALVSVNWIDAAQVKYELPYKNAQGASVTLRGSQFVFLVSPQDLYVLTVSGDAASDSFTTVMDQIGKSFVAVKK